MSEPEQVTPPSGPWFSWWRVGEAVFLVLLAAGTFAAIWFFPWPTSPKRQPADTQITTEKLQRMRRQAERQAAEKRAEREGTPP